MDVIFILAAYAIYCVMCSIATILGVGLVIKWLRRYYYISFIENTIARINRHRDRRNKLLKDRF